MINLSLAGFTLPPTLPTVCQIGRANHTHYLAAAITGGRVVGSSRVVACWLEQKIPARSEPARSSPLEEILSPLLFSRKVPTTS